MLLFERQQRRFHGQALRECVVLDQTHSPSLSDQPRYVGYSCNSGHRAATSEESSLSVTPHSRADAIMNHNKESQAHAPLAGLLLGMQSSTFQSRIWALLSSRRVRDTSKYGCVTLSAAYLRHSFPDFGNSGSTAVMRLILWSASKNWLSLNHCMAKRNIIMVTFGH